MTSIWVINPGHGWKKLVHVCLQGHFTNLPFGICASYSDLRVFLWDRLSSLTNMTSPLKMDGWNTSLSFWDGLFWRVNSLLVLGSVPTKRLPIF